MGMSPHWHRVGMNPKSGKLLGILVNEMQSSAPLPRHEAVVSPHGHPDPGFNSSPGEGPEGRTSQSRCCSPLEPPDSMMHNASVHDSEKASFWKLFGEPPFEHSRRLNLHRDCWDLHRKSSKVVGYFTPSPSPAKNHPKATWAGSFSSISMLSCCANGHAKRA